jgi:hypothetical protein
MASFCSVERDGMGDVTKAVFILTIAAFVHPDKRSDINNAN